MICNKDPAMTAQLYAYKSERPKRWAVGKRSMCVRGAGRRLLR